MYGGLLVRATLEADSFPPCSLYAARTVIVGRGDLRSPGDRKTSSDGADRQAPYIIYGENFMPTQYGVASAGFLSTAPAAEDSTEVFTHKYEARDDTGKRWYLGKTRTGMYWIDSTKMDQWRKLEFPKELQEVTDFETRVISVAYVEGITYVFVGKHKCYYVDFETTSLKEVILTSLDTTKIKGICAGSNYVIAYDNATIYWGAADNVEDFTPDIETGADATIPLDLRGQIVTCVSIPQGFLIYTTTNVIAASYTSNLASPWIFKEIPGSAGVADVEQVSNEENFAEHIAWTQSGLMQINRIECKLIHGEVSDFLSGRLVEVPSTDPTDIVPKLETMGTSFKVKVQLVASRYLVLSFGTFSLTQALIYDQLLKRWGRLQLDHVDVFELVAGYRNGKAPWTALRQTSWKSLKQTRWKDFEFFQEDIGTPLHNIAFLKANGEIVVVNTDEFNFDRQGMVAIGKMRFSRDTFVEIQRVLLNYVNKTDSFSVYASVSYDGITREPPAPLFKMDATNGSMLFLTDLTGYDVILYLKGVFNLSDLEFSVLQRGRQ